MSQENIHRMEAAAAEAELPVLAPINYNTEGLFDRELDGPALVDLYRNQSFRRALAEVQAMGVVSDSLLGLDLTCDEGRLEAIKRQARSESLGLALDLIQALLTDNNLAEFTDAP